MQVGGWITIGLIVFVVICVIVIISKNSSSQNSYATSEPEPTTIDDLVRQRDQREQRKREKQREEQEANQRKILLEYEESRRKEEAEKAENERLSALATQYFLSSEVEQLKEMLRDLYSKGLADYPEFHETSTFISYCRMELKISVSEYEAGDYEYTTVRGVYIRVMGNGTIMFEGSDSRAVPYAEWANNPKRLESELVYAYRHPSVWTDKHWAPGAGTDFG